MNSVNTSPYFSIIIPTRNRAHLLTRAIDSVMAQKFDNWELVIVDDGSTDDTKTVIYSYEDQRIKYFYQKFSERSTARNVGIEKAIGKYICFLDDDDEYLDNYLLDFYTFYQANRCSGSILRTGFIKLLSNKEIPSINYQKSRHTNPVNFVFYNMCGVWSLSIPRAFLNDIKFPPEFPHWQDTHLIIRLLLEYDFVQLDNYNYLYHIHDNMGSKLAIIDYDPIARADLNVAAIENLFLLEKNRLSEYIPENTLRFLKAEKYLEYAVNTRDWRLLKKSIRYGVYVKCWKLYIMFFKRKYVK